MVDAATAAVGTDDMPMEEQQASVSSRQSRHNNYSASHGSSSVGGAVFNFTNSIVGAGAIGLGGSFAVSGGMISIFLVIFFAILTKISLDLIVSLSVNCSDRHHHQQQQHGTLSYEELGHKAYGHVGQLAVLACKFLYSFGCLVAYLIVLKDNFAPAVQSLVYGNGEYSPNYNIDNNHSWMYDVLNHTGYVTWILSTLIVLPLCLLREASALSRFSLVSIVSMVAIVIIVIYLYVANPNHIRHDGPSFYEKWWQVRPGVLDALGTFVFTYVSQHTAHLMFESLRPELQTIPVWKRISTYSLTMTCIISLTVAMFAYMTFWEDTQSDIFQIYPAIPLIDIAKLLLCITMLLTFPLPFMTCRELVVVFFALAVERREQQRQREQQQQQQQLTEEQGLDESFLHEPLLANHSESQHNHDAQEQDIPHNISIADSDDPCLANSSILSLDLRSLSASVLHVATSVIHNDNDKQLTTGYHVLVTCKLWFLVTGLAVTAPTLGDILDLVGCATGTLIGFVFPALIAFRLQGFSFTALLLLVIGVTVGTVGTFSSVKQLMRDI